MNGRVFLAFALVLIALNLSSAAPQTQLSNRSSMFLSASKRLPGSLLPFSKNPKDFSLIETLRKEGPATPIFSTKYRAKFANKPNPLLPSSPVDGNQFVV